VRKKELAKLTAQRQQKVAERDRILALFRRGRIDEQVLDQQLDLIQNETATLQAQIDSASRALAIPDRAAQLESAAKLLQDLQRELHEQPISPELQRRLIEILGRPRSVHGAQCNIPRAIRSEPARGGCCKRDRRFRGPERRSLNSSVNPLFCIVHRT
jgi:hypothetical protein